MTTYEKRRQRRRIRTFRRTCGAIAFVLFFLLIGTVGSIEQDTIPILTGFIRCTVIEAALVGFTYLSGAFVPARSTARQSRRKEADRHGHHGKAAA